MSDKPRFANDRLIAGHQRLMRLLEVQIPGHELEWTEQAQRALDAVQSALHDHRKTVEIEDGLFAQVDLTRPSLVRQVGELRQEHGELSDRIERLKTEIQKAKEAFQPVSPTPQPAVPAPKKEVEIPEFATLRKQLEDLGTSLEKHWQEEAGLVLESTMTDIGAGD